ncbi:hypothetical protein [Amycolatopsis suaedae]|uniref:Antibiotic biosynthesis monooxygenase n=1 Tax=Amycolatopsis suaedae TaxID=2510978 RepID=A0A4Q7J163_9PSEU|nr:hypothetical protein [Amycolatopsis suaedae]RZQ61120.1 hypothetical protein EWH70_24850 [Amycolatopsis suaedae]
MPKTFVVQYAMRPDTADENQRLVERVFAELAERAPGGLHYASFRLADGVTFVHIGSFEGDGDGLTETEAFREFQRQFADRAAGAPTASDATLVGSYGFLG